MSLVTFAPTEAMQVTLRPRIYKVDIGKVGFTGPTGPTGPPGTSTAPSYTKAAMLALPSPTAGNIVRVTDDIRGLWMYTGTQWKSITGWADVTDFGAKGDGVTDDGAAVRTAALAAAGKTLYFPSGTFLLGFGAHPSSATTYAMFYVPTKTHVRGAGRDSTILKLPNSTASPAGSTETSLIRVLSGGSEQITFEDLTVDGNAANQSGQTMQHQGIRWQSSSGIYMNRVRVMNLHGLGYAPDAPTTGDIETMGITFDSCSDCVVTDCQVVRTAGSTSSGFSANSSVSIRYVNCIALGMTVSCGFTHNACRQVSHTNCHAFDNALSGFNSELSEEPLYAACISGGRGTAISATPYSADENLGNGRGFNLYAATHFQVVGCSARYNSAWGVIVQNGSSGAIIGGALTNNVTGISIDTASYSLVSVSQSTEISGNSTAQWSTPFGTGDPRPAHVVGYYCSTPGYPTTTILLDDRLYAIPVDLLAGSWDQLAINVTGAGSANSVLRLALFDAAPLTPGPLIVDAGTVSATTLGVKTLTIAKALSSGKYWLGLVGQGAPTTQPTVGATFVINGTTHSASPLNANGFLTPVATGITGAIPTNPTWTVAATLATPRVGIRRA